MLVFDNDGHTLISESMKNREFFLAIGDSDTKWGYGEAPRYNGELMNSFAFIREHSKNFVVEDKDGLITFNDKKYSVSETPTNILSISFKLEGKELQGRDIRQEVIVSNISPLEEFENKIFLKPKEMNIEPLKKIIGENISPKKIEHGSNEVLNYVLTF